MKTKDELLECLLIVARAHGELPTRDMLMSGLPAEHARLTPALFARAAKRTRMSSQIVKAPLTALKSPLLPAIALLEGERACVVLAVDEASQQVRVAYPELPESPVDLPVDELQQQSTGHVIYVRPVHRYDARSPQIRRPRDGHWFWSVIGESRPLYRDVLLAALLANAFALGMPLFTMNVYDRVVPNQAFETLWVLAVGVLIMLLGDLLFRVMRGYFVDLASSRADVKLSAGIMEHVLGMRMEQRPVSAGSFAANLRAFESVRDFIGSATVTAFIDLPFVLIYMATIGWIAWPMLVPLILGAFVMLGYALLVQGRMHQLAETTSRAGAQRNATLVEGLVGFETVKSLAAESAIQRTWELNAALLARVGARLRLLASTSANVSAFVQQSINLVLIVVGVYLIADAQLTLGGLIACTMLAGRAMAPVGQVAGLMVQYHTAATALTSLDELMGRETARPAGASFISRGRINGAIELRDVSFSYPGQKAPALQNVSLRILPGEKVAVLGRIGSGKSTLAKLILGLYRPTEGAVLLDDIDIAQLDPAELRRQIGYVQQDVMLFYGSLKDNIGLGAPLAEHEDIVAAARFGGLAHHINRHPQGFDLPVGERGESLSGGQRQGVAIARAVINDPAILLLDEPTSSMDHSSEESIKRRLREFAGPDKTMLIITHRNSMLELADRIIVMDGGRVVADGPKAQVVAALREGRIGKAPR